MYILDSSVMNGFVYKHKSILRFGRETVTAMGSDMAPFVFKAIHLSLWDFQAAMGGRDFGTAIGQAMTLQWR